VFTCRLNMRGQPEVRVSDSPSQSEPLSVDMLNALDPAPAEHPLPDDSARSRLVPLDGRASTRACPRKDIGVGCGLWVGGRGDDRSCFCFSWTLLS
jgi:hypothetical protein